MSGQQGGQPIDNLTYNLISSLASKLEAVDVYKKYLNDVGGDEACRKLFQQMLDDDTRHAASLKKELTRHLGGSH